MYPIEAEVDAVIDDDVEVLVVSPPRTTEEAADAEPVPARQVDSAPSAEPELRQDEAEHPPQITVIPSSDSGLQVN